MDTTTRAKEHRKSLRGKRESSGEHVHVSSVHFLWLQSHVLVLSLTYCTCTSVRGVGINLSVHFCGSCYRHLRCLYKSIVLSLTYTCQCRVFVTEEREKSCFKCSFLWFLSYTHYVSIPTVVLSLTCTSQCRV